MIFKDLGLLVDILKAEKYSCNRYLDKIYREFYLFITVPIWTHFLMLQMEHHDVWKFHCMKLKYLDLRSITKSATLPNHRGLGSLKLYVFHMV